MSDASRSLVVRRVLLVTLAASAVAVVPGRSGDVFRLILPQAAAVAAFAALWLGGGKPVGWLRTTWPLLGLVGPAVVSTFFAVDSERALFGGVSAPGLTHVLGLCGVAAATALAADGCVARVRLLLAGLVAATTAFALLQRFGLDPLADRAAPTAGAVRAASSSALGFGGYLALAAAFVHGGAQDAAEPPRRRQFYALTPAIAALGMFLSGARWPMVALAAGLAAVAVLRMIAAKRHGASKVLLFGGLLALATALPGVRGSPDRPSFLLDPAREAGAARDQLHAEANRAMAEAPGLRKALGFGPAHVRVVAPRRPADPGLAADELDPGYERTHSLMHELLLTTGWLGVAGFTLFLTFLFVYGTWERKSVRTGAVGALAAYVVLRLAAAPAPETELLFAVVAGFLLRPGKDETCADLGAVGGVRLDARATGALAFGALLTGVGLATSVGTPTLLAVVGLTYVAALVGRAEPLRVAAAVGVVFVAVAWRPFAVAVAARDDAREAWQRTSPAAYVGAVETDGRARSFELVAAAACALRAEGDDGAARARALLERAARADRGDRLPELAAARLPASPTESRGLADAAVDRALTRFDTDAELHLARAKRLAAAGDVEGFRAALGALRTAAALAARYRDVAGAAALHAAEARAKESAPPGFK
jgi:hypothetical protein